MTISHIKEVCLYLPDLDRAEEFYHGKLGLSVISKVAGRHIFFRAGTTVLLCFIPEVTAQETTLPPHYAHGKQHLAFEVEDYPGWVERLNALEIPITHTQPWHGGRESVYFEDPFGHVLELVPPGLWDPPEKN
ncbi:MAG TPA: glyoxalase [Cytophagales bacterium]|nr:glyoxalase [Cytophagales bacterium]HAP64988.1 glyoxalase [Cytophagales bacterium]